MTKTETYSYKTILQKAKNIRKNVEKDFKIGESPGWGYYIAKTLINKKKEVTKINIANASKPFGDTLSRQISQKDYLSMAERLCAYVEKNKQMPNYVKCGSLKVRVRDFVYMFARTLIWWENHNQMPNWTEINSKAFTKPTETGNFAYDYFIKVFGKFGDTIDGALKKVDGKGYGSYYDDHKSNQETIDAMANSRHDDDPNCTDSCHVFYNIGQVLVKKGRYKKVECIHVKCKVSGAGHVRLKVTKNDNSVFYRDPASCLNGEGVTSNWCLNGTQLAVNPYWFMQNVNR